MKKSPFFFLLLILIFAFLVRVSGFWVANYYIDEAILLDRARKIVTGEEIFNPDFVGSGIAYGMLISYIQALFMKLVYLFGHWFWGWDSVNAAYLSLKTATRFLSVSAGTAIVYFTYLSAKKLFNYKVGLFSGLVLAFSFNHVAQSKYALVDIFVSLFVALSLYFSIIVLIGKRGILKAYIFGSLFAALAFAVKYNIPVFIPILTAYSLVVWQSVKVREKAKKPFLYLLKWWRKEIFIFCFVVVITFLLVNPYLLINPANYFWQLQTILKASWNFPHGARDLDGIPNILWYFVYMAKIGLYYPFFIFVVVGIVMALRQYRNQAILLLSYPFSQLILLEIYTPRSDRYPSWWLPMLAIFAGFFLWKSFNFGFRFRKKILIASLVLLIGVSMFRVLAFDFAITFQKDTRQEAKGFLIKKHRPIYFILDVDGKFMAFENRQILDGRGLRLMSLDPQSKFPQNVFRYPGEYLLMTDFIYGEHLYLLRHNPESKIFNSRSENTEKFLNLFLKEGKFVTEFMQKARFVKQYSRFGFANGLFDSVRLYGGGTDVGMSYNPTIRIYQIPQSTQVLPAISVIYYPQPVATSQQEILSIVNGSRVVNDQVILMEKQSQTNSIIQASRSPFPPGEYAVKISLKISDFLIPQRIYGFVTFGDRKIKDNISYQEIKGVNLRKTREYQTITLPFKLSVISYTSIELAWLDASQAMIEKIEIDQTK